MGTRPKESMEQRLTRANTVISGALTNPEIAALLAQVGYTTEIIQEGQALYTTAYQLYEQQKVEYAEQHEATGNLRSAREQAEKVYRKYRKMAKVALKKDIAQQEKLDILTRMKKSYTGWVAQGKRFYQNALADEDILTKLARFAVTVENLQAGQALIASVEELKTKQQQESSQSQEATRQRDEALDALEDWFSDFMTIAKIALEEKPQLMEMLGIVVK